ncbi:hypothetical protein LTS10_000792 [Elasticomyces elasticus]|nr:hypothetical protein LTS10_000792 [Elasticomyces elasticus]
MCTYTIRPGVGDDAFFWTLWTPYVDHFENGTQRSTGYSSSTWWNTTVSGPYDKTVSSGLADITNLIFDPLTFTTSSVENGTLHDHPTFHVPIHVDSTWLPDHFYPAWVGEQAVSHAEIQSWVADPTVRPDEAYFIDPVFPSIIPTILADALSFTYFHEGIDTWAGDGGSATWNADSLTNTTAQLNTLNALLPSKVTTGGDSLGWSQAVFESRNGSNISAILDNVAVALTNLIRQIPNATSIMGSVHRPNVLIHIRWPWFIYPVSISTLSIVFLVLVVSLSRRKGELVWKASSAALAFHGLHGGQDSGVNLVDTLKISDAAKSEWVKLAADDDGRLAFRTS